MNRDDFVKDRKIARRLGLNTSLKKGTGGINPCFRPSGEASRADLIEYHREDMRLRRAHQRDRKPNVIAVRRSKNSDPAYRKSIWPASKIARRGAA